MRAKQPKSQRKKGKKMALLTEQQKAELKTKLYDYLTSRGVSITKDNFLTCLNPGHNDSGKKPANMSYHPKEHYLHCFSCNATYDIFSACEQLEGIPQGQGVKHIAALYGYRQSQPTKQTNSQPMPALASPAPKQPEPQPEPQQPVKDFTAEVMHWHEQLPFYDYHTSRGISDAVASRFRLGYTEMPYTQDTALVIPMQRVDGTYSYQLRNINPDAPKERKHHKPKKDIAGEAPIFNLQAIGATDKPLFITEAAIDALSVIEAGGEAVGLNGVGNQAKLIEQLQAKAKGQPIILALDNDKAGRKTQAEIKQALQTLKIACYEIDACFGHKDANEALQRKPERFRAIVGAIKDEAAAREKEYLQRTVERDLNDFVGQLATKRPPAISTGFKSLDDILRGGLREGLICIGGISSLGKTTLALQIMDNIAAHGRDVLVFSLEMSRDELRAKSIAKESYKASVELTGFSTNAINTLEVLDKELREQLPHDNQDNFKEAFNRYRQYANRLFIHEAVGKFTVNDIKQAVEEHIRATGRTPVVLVDYLQILQPAEPGLSDKAKVSYDVLMLKQLSRDKHTPVVVVSSFNRDSYDREASFSSFKESGEIEYSADVLIALQLTAVRTGQDVQEALEETPRQVDVRFLKNRNGLPGIASFNAMLAYNYFEEMDKEGIAQIRRSMQAKKDRQERKSKA